MDLEQRLRASMVAPKPGPMFTARVLARIARGAARRRSRFILLGTMLVVGAAAAMLAWRMSDMQPRPVVSTAIAAMPGAGPVAKEPVVQTAEAGDPVAAKPMQPQIKEISPRYSVLVMPLRQQGQDQSKRDPVQTLHAAMVEELRKVPGLTLRVPGEAERGSGDQPDYVLTLISLARRVSPSGAIVFRSTDGGTTYSLINGAIVTSSGNGSAVSNTRISGDPANIQWVEVVVEPRQAAASRFNLPVGADGAAETLAQLAATQIENLRLQVFPPDSGFQQRVVAQLGDPGEDQPRRLKVLQVLQTLARDGGSRLDADTIQAIVRYAATQPVLMRANVWATLRWAQVSHPALVAPLVECLRRDPDQQVRLVALGHLETNFSGNPVVRSALERIGQEDPDGIVRVMARRALYGQAQWRDEIMTALHDNALSYEARLAPLIVSKPVISSQQQEHRRAVVREPQVLRPLIALIQQHLQDADHAQATSDVLVLLGSVDDPAIFNLFLQVMRETPALKRETTVQTGGRSVDMSGPVSAWVLNHRDDPRVLASLSDVDPQLRTMIERSRSMAEHEVPATLDDVIPSNLLERIREITEKKTPRATVTQ
jgi:hypothetical protein